MINIFNAATTIHLDHRLSIASAQALSGRRQAQRRGPYLYVFTVELGVMTNTSDIYHDINSDLRVINYGVDTANVSIPNGIIPDVRGSFEGSPNVFGADQTGKTVQMSGFSVSKTNVIRDGDFLQFSNSSKVFQAVGDYDSNNVGFAVAKGTTNLGVLLNNALVVSPVSGTSLTTGADVVFKLYLEDYTDPTLTPASATTAFANWGSFTFIEAI